MTGIGDKTRVRMMSVLKMFITNSNEPTNKTGIINDAPLQAKSYNHTIHSLKVSGFIQKHPKNSRRWLATGEGISWVVKSITQDKVREAYDGDAMRHSRVNPDASSKKCITNPHQPTVDMIRLNLTDINQFIHAIIGDRSNGEVSWTRDGRQFLVKVENGVVNLFLGQESDSQ